MVFRLAFSPATLVGFAGTPQPTAAHVGSLGFPTGSRFCPSAIQHLFSCASPSLLPRSERSQQGPRLASHPVSTSGTYPDASIGRGADCSTTFCTVISGLTPDRGSYWSFGDG